MKSNPSWKNNKKPKKAVEYLKKSKQFKECWRKAKKDLNLRSKFSIKGRSRDEKKEKIASY